MESSKIVSKVKRDDRYYKNLKLKEKIFEKLFMCMALMSVLMIVTICVFLFGEGFKFFSNYSIIKFLTSSKWAPTANPESFGILSMIITSFITTFLSIIFSLPIGVMVAIFMSYYCSKRYYSALKSLINLMAAIPSIIYGFFALMIIVPFNRKVFIGNGLTIFTASILLSIMILPTIISISENAIKSVDKKIFLASMALGATKEESIVKVVIRAAKSGIIASSVLGVGRSIGETMAVYMVIGNQARMPSSIFQGSRSLTTNIVLEMSYAGANHTRALISTACILFIVILIINTIFFYIKRRIKL